MFQLILKIVLAPLFFLVVTPLAIIIRLSNIDLIEKNISEKEASYWKTVDTDQLQNTKSESE